MAPGPTAHKPRATPDAGRKRRSVDRGATPATLHEAALGQGLSINKESDVIRPLPTDVHEAGTQPFLQEAEASAHTQRPLVLGAHAHLDAMQAQLADDEVEDKSSHEGPQASSSPL